MLKVVAKVYLGGLLKGYEIYDTESRITALYSKHTTKRLNLCNAKVRSDGILYNVTGKITTKNIDTAGKALPTSKYVLLYHGSKSPIVHPAFSKGKDKHDYGNGFYLTPFCELAKEWAMSDKNTAIGYVHTYILNLQGLQILNFNQYSSLVWLAELMKHRIADASYRYERFAPAFINKFSIDSSGYDIIYGWRADSSYFSIAKRFVRDELDYILISELFHLGNLENQFCLKSIRVFDRLIRYGNPIIVTPEYHKAYMNRDEDARNRTRQLILSARNTMKKGFTYVMEEGFKI